MRRVSWRLGALAPRRYHSFELGEGFRRDFLSLKVLPHGFGVFGSFQQAVKEGVGDEPSAHKGREIRLSPKPGEQHDGYDDLQAHGNNIGWQLRSQDEEREGDDRVAPGDNGACGYQAERFGDLLENQGESKLRRFGRREPRPGNHNALPGNLA